MLRRAVVLSIVVCVIASALAGVLRAQSLGEIAAAEARRKAAGAKPPANGNADSQTPEKTKTDPGGKAAEKPKAAAATASSPRTAYQESSLADVAAAAQRNGAGKASRSITNADLPKVPERAPRVDDNVPMVRGASTRQEVVRAALASTVTIKTPSGSGSGFFVTDTGLVITNAHVVAGASRIVIRTQATETFGTIVRLAVEDDLALVRANIAAAVALPLGDSDAVQVGDDVIAVGSPLGLEGTVTRGIISNLRPVLGGRIPLIQFDAAISPGNSGGPLLDERGQVLGVNTLKALPQGAESLGFAISINHVKAVFGPLLSQ